MSFLFRDTYVTSFLIFRWFSLGKYHAKPFDTKSVHLSQLEFECFYCFTINFFFLELCSLFYKKKNFFFLIILNSPVTNFIHDKSKEVNKICNFEPHPIHIHLFIILAF